MSEPEPDQIDMMTPEELRTELRKLLTKQKCEQCGFEIMYVVCPSCFRDAITQTIEDEMRRIKQL